MNQLTDQPGTGKSPVEHSTTLYTAADYRRFIAEQEQRADEAPTANARKTAELRAEAYRQQLAELGAPSGVVVDEVVFDAEVEAQLAGIDPATAANIRSIARQLAAAATAYNRGYANGYVDGVRERLGVPTVGELVSAVVAATEPTVLPAIDPSIAERFLDDAYDAMDQWATKLRTNEPSYVEAGHDALAALDNAMVALQDARRKMADEIGLVDGGCFEVGGSADGDLVSKSCNCGAEIAGSRIEVKALFADHVAQPRRAAEGADGVTA